MMEATEMTPFADAKSQAQSQYDEILHYISGAYGFVHYYGDGAVIPRAYSYANLTVETIAEINSAQRRHKSLILMTDAKQITTHIITLNDLCGALVASDTMITKHDAKNLTKLRKFVTACRKVVEFKDATFPQTLTDWDNNFRAVEKVREAYLSLMEYIRENTPLPIIPSLSSSSFSIWNYLYCCCCCNYKPATFEIDE